MVISHVVSRLRVGDDAPAVSEGRKVALPGGARKQAHFREGSTCCAGLRSIWSRCSIRVMTLSSSPSSKIFSQSSRKMLSRP